MPLAIRETYHNAQRCVYTTFFYNKCCAQTTILLYLQREIMKTNSYGRIIQKE